MRTTDRERDARGRVLLPLLAVVVVVVVALALLVRLGAGPFPDAESCGVTVGKVDVELSPDQAENASLIAGIGIRRGLPARAVSIALATAFQESKLENLSAGDRDSAGLFQQRPSQGWGTREQILDPVYAADAFYDALVEVEGYQEMRITEAAQAVQRSGFPEAYEEHTEGARALASALTGYSEGKLSCVVHSEDHTLESAGASGLTNRASQVRQELESVFGPLPLGGFDPGGVSTGHLEGSAHYDGRAIDVFVRPVTETNQRRGWAMAQFLVAHADSLDIDHVIFDARIWTSGSRSEEGWNIYTPAGTETASPEALVVLEHLDHVHVDVVEGG